MTMYKDSVNLYGCMACGRRWAPSAVYHRWPIRIVFSRRWSFWRKHGIETGATDYEQKCFATVYHLGFIRVVTGHKGRVIHGRPFSGCVYCSIELAGL